MTTPILGTKGANLDLLVKQGATLGPNTMYIRDSGGIAINLTNCTLSAQIRKTADAPTADVSAVFTVLDAPNGVVSWVFPAAETINLVCDPDSESAAASQYVWDMELHYTLTSAVAPLLYGNVSVYREVTK